MCNVIHTIVREPFSEWVKDQVAERNEMVKSKRNMMIELDPELAKVFAASTQVSQ